MQFIKINNQKRPLTPFDPKYYSNNYNKWNKIRKYFMIIL